MNYKKKNVKKTCILLALFITVLLLPTQAKAKTSIKLSKTNATMYVRNSIQLGAVVKGTSSRVKWSSSNSSIASVSANGVVTAKKAGTVIITAKVKKVSKKCRVLVKANVTDISKVINLSLDSAAAALGYKQVVRSNIIYTLGGTYSSSKSYISGMSYYRNQAGKWDAVIKDKTLSAYGVKIGMNANDADKYLKRYGWQLYSDGLNYSSGSSVAYRMYGKSGGSIINVGFRNKIVCDITYQWQMESEF